MPACICIQFQLVTSMNNFALSIYLVPATGGKKRETVEEKVIQLKLLARSRGVRRKVEHYVVLRTQRRHAGTIKRGCRLAGNYLEIYFFSHLERFPRSVKRRSFSLGNQTAINVFNEKRKKKTRWWKDRGNTSSSSSLFLTFCFSWQSGEYFQYDTLLFQFSMLQESRSCIFYSGGSFLKRKAAPLSTVRDPPVICRRSFN